MAHGPGTATLMERIALGGPILQITQLNLTSLPDLPPTLRELHCSDNRLTVLPVLPPTLRRLICGGNLLTVLPELPPTLETLTCAVNKLTVLPALPPTLVDLRCYENELTVLPELPPTLQSLYCGENKLTVLPALPPTLKDLNCRLNNLTVLPELPPTLETLTCASNKLTVLPALPPALIGLGCNANQLTVLPELPPTLLALSCISNKLTVLPALPLRLMKLFCSDNELTVLPALPPTLYELRCRMNHITELPALPPTLEVLTCSDIGLTVLPALPPTLKQLQCHGNMLTVLPALPPTLRELHCDGNMLTVLPALPPGLTMLRCGPNSHLTKVTLPFPQALLLHRIRDVFIGCPLYPPGVGDETLGQYQIRIQVPVEGMSLWKGYSDSDVKLFNGIFTTRGNDISFCPVCLAYSERQDGCMYMKHTCKMPFHGGLYNKYKNEQGQIGWCTLCGRVCLGHKHYELNFPEGAPVLIAMPGSDPFATDCRTSGGGGAEEKHRRVERLLNYACQLQEEVGKIPHLTAITELVEEVWKGASLRDRTTLKKIEEKKFAFPCTFPKDERPVAEVVYPPVPRPEGEAAPVEHASPPAECMSELEPTANGQPVFQFIHTQPDGSVRPHPETEWICGQHLEETLKESLFTGLCFLQPSMCKARLYPVELEGKVSAEYLASYTKLFNEKFAVPTAGRRRHRRTYRVHRKYRGGAGPSIMNKIDQSEIQCEVPTKSGRRRTRSTRPLGPRGRKSRRTSRRFSQAINNGPTTA